MKYECYISSKMREVTEVLTNTFVKMNHCVVEYGRNLIVEVPKQMCEIVRLELKKYFSDVALMKNAYYMFDDLHDFILVKPLISESPITQNKGVYVPELEKFLVDFSSDKEFSMNSEDMIQKQYQKAFELFEVNTSRLLRYAGRKGKKDEVLHRLSMIDRNRVETIRTIQAFFRDEPVIRAWLFGSFSRMEEGPESDIDILVDIDNSIPMGLLQYSAMINELESRLNRKVELVTLNSVKSFAQENINRDKVLIYERS